MLEYQVTDSSFGRLPDSDSESDSFSLTPFHALGVDMALRYAERILPHKSKDSLESGFKRLISESSKNVAGFDWFAATMYIIKNGNYIETKRTLNIIANSRFSQYLWPRDSQQLSHQFCRLRSVSCHFIEAIIDAELPLLSSAFRLSRCSPSQV